MYKELYAAWQREMDDPTLGALQSDFYAKIAEYLRRIKEDDKVLDKKSVKMNLLEHEAQNVERMLKDLLDLRYKKIIKTVSKSQKVPSDLLTNEEAQMSETFFAFTGEYQKLSKNLMDGQQTQAVPVVKVITRPEAQPTHKRLSIRFIKNIPAIMGADMKSYGPFVAEDVASLPPQNAQILVKQGLAVLVEVS